MNNYLDSHLIAALVRPIKSRFGLQQLKKYISSHFSTFT